MPTDSERVSIVLNGQPTDVPANCTVAAAILSTGETAFRRSVTAEPRGPLCGMGICYECVVTINGEPHQKSCQRMVEPGLQVRTRE